MLSEILNRWKGKAHGVFFAGIIALILFLTCTISGLAEEMTAFEDWAKYARIGGATVWTGMESSEMNQVVTKMFNENVTVIEADSDLSQYQTDLEFAQELALMRQIAIRVHNKGMKIVWYYPALEVITKNGETGASSMYKDHPTWVQLGLDGSPNVFYGSGTVFWVEEGDESAWMSPSSPYRDYLYERVALIAATGIDGLWMDVPLLNDIKALWADTNPYSVAAFTAETGLNVPTTEDWTNPAWRKWVSWRHKEISDYLEGLKAVCQAVNPQFPIFIETVTMDYNAATGIALDGSDIKYSEGMTQVWELDAISDTSSMRNAKEDDWVSMIAMNKFARGASGSKPSWMFGYGKDPDDAKLVMAEILAAGNNPYETKIPEMTTSVGVDYRTKMFGWIKDNNTYLYDRKTAAKVAIYYSSPSRDFVDKNGGVGLYATTTKPSGVTEWWSSDISDSAYSRQYVAEHRGMVKILVHSSIPFDIIVNPDSTELNQYETIIFPDVEAISSFQADLIRQYVNNGGKVIFTGPNPSGLNELGDEESNYLLADVLGFNKGSTGIPSNVYGEGEVRYFPGLLGKDYFKNSTPSVLAQIKAAVLETSTSLINTNADPRVHFETSYSGDNLILQMVNFIGVDGTFSVIPTSFEVTLAIPVGKQAETVSLTSPDNLPSALEPVVFTQIGQNISFNMSLSEYSMVVVGLTNDNSSAPIIVADPTTPTNGSVFVTITYGADATVKEYKIGSEGVWTAYTTAIELSSNNIVYARGTDVGGQVSPEGSLEISNIDKFVPEVPTGTATPTTQTSGTVTVTITYSEDSDIKEFKVGALGTYASYTAPIMLTHNDTVYFRGQDAAGNWSEEGSLIVNNIIDVTVSGYASWYKIIDNAGINVTVKQDGAVKDTKVTDTNGFFEFVLANGTYTFELNVDGYLKTIVGNVVVGGTSLVISTEAQPLIMRAGDINGNGLVDLTDLVIFSNVYGSKVGQTNYLQAADFNKDESIDLTDLVHFSNHYGEKSE